MVYKCSICGYEYDEEKEGKPFSGLTACPVCRQPPEKFSPADIQNSQTVSSDSGNSPASTNSMHPDYPEIGRAHV